jgi:tRNA(Ile)-lysidine synthase
VAVSGGRDSTALLHCCAALCRQWGLRVLALHVHHGLVAEADVWLQQVRRQARRWGAGFDSRRLQGAPQPGESIEAWARRERYAALAEMARQGGASLVLLAHHRRDQAETWLLQALRGGGPAGLSAMPRQLERDGILFARPWLDQPREAIEAYVRRHRLRFADDGSNEEDRFARNRLRLRVWPGLLAAFPQAEAALAQSCLHAQEAAALAQECAVADLARCSGPRGLELAAWNALPPARRRNALRHWLARRLPGGNRETLVQRLMEGLRPGRSAQFPAPGASLRLYRGWLQVVPAAASAAAAPASPEADAAGAAHQQPLRLDAPGWYTLPGWPLGQLLVQPSTQGGISVERLRHVVARPRQGGERFQRAPDTPPRSLKLQFQAAGVPAGQRLGPLLFDAQDRLLFVPGLGVDARSAAAPGHRQCSLQWLPADGSV